MPHRLMQISHKQQGFLMLSLVSHTCRVMQHKAPRHLWLLKQTFEQW